VDTYSYSDGSTPVLGADKGSFSAPCYAAEHTQGVPSSSVIHKRLSSIGVSYNGGTGDTARLEADWHLVQQVWVLDFGLDEG